MNMQRNGSTSTEDGSTMRASGSESRAVAESVAEVAELGQRERQNIGLSEHIAHRVTLLSGTMVFVVLHIIWFTVWIALNSGLFGFEPFDEFPFTFLTMIVSLEAIFLSVFVLITQNQLGRESDRRAKVDLEINVIAEREVTEALKALKSIQDHLGITDHEAHELDEMQSRTRVKSLVDQTDVAEGA
jgi:uncharacterized membrane protein